jgi:hypothetical protein
MRHRDLSVGKTPSSRGEPPRLPGLLGEVEAQDGRGVTNGRRDETPSSRGEPRGGSLGLLGEVEAQDGRGAAKGHSENA